MVVSLCVVLKIKPGSSRRATIALTSEPVLQLPFLCLGQSLTIVTQAGCELTVKPNLDLKLDLSAQAPGRVPGLSPTSLVRCPMSLSTREPATFTVNIVSSFIHLLMNKSVDMFLGRRGGFQDWN